MNPDTSICVHTRTDSKLLNPSHLKAKTKVKKKNIILFADNAAVVAYSPSYIQYLMDRSAKVCTVFELTISAKNKFPSKNHYIT